MQEQYDLSNPYDWLKKYKTWNMTARLLGSKSTTANLTNMMLRRLALIANVVDGSKTCPKCEITKTIDNFTIDNSRFDGYARLCRECDNARRRKRYNR